MPIEIRELVIRGVVGPENFSPPPPGSAHDEQPTSAAAAIDIDALVQECVRQVMRVLARERDR